MGKINIGTSGLSKCYVGNSEIDKIYLGNNLLYSAGPPPWSCTVSGLGSSSYSSVTFSHSGTMPTFEEVTIGNDVFIKIPKMYRKIKSLDTNYQIKSFTITNVKPNETQYYVYPCFLKEDGTTEMDYILIGKYGTNSTSQMNSQGTTIRTLTISNAQSLSRARGTGYLLYDWQIHRLWQDLLICKMNTINTNSGSGIDYDAFGIRWSSNTWWIDGMMAGSYYYSYCLSPSEYVSLSSPNDVIPNTYTSSTNHHPSYSECISSLDGKADSAYIDKRTLFFNFPTRTVYNSSFNTYYCDRFYIQSGSSGLYPVRTNVGEADARNGAFQMGVLTNWTSSNCARLCYRPI